MNDYKELIEELKRNGLSNGGALGHHSGLCDEAADAIEQFAKDIDVLTKERDAAVEDLKVNANCTNCKYLNGEGYCVANWCYNGEAWEWRGVQE